MEKIKSIKEAFSMQPATISVVDKPSSFGWEDSIERIELELYHDEGVYVGYNFDGKAKFRYLIKSVNVHY